MKEMIIGDIEKIKDVLKYKSSDRAKDLQEQLIPKYETKIKNIHSGLHSRSVAVINTMYHGTKTNDINYLKNLEILKGKLEMLLIEESKPKDQPVSPFNFNTYNNSNSSSDNHADNTLSNTNSNTVSIELLFEQAKKNIDDNDSLTDDEISEILSKIEELESLHNSNEKPRTKWSKAKETMTWLFDKGSKVAVEILPLITEVIK